MVAQKPRPVGAITSLFTDIEGSTRLAHELGEAWLGVLQDHNAVLRGVIADHHGVEVSTAGDSFFVVFERASDAVAGAVAVQHALGAHDWSPHPPIRVRIGMHTGDAVLHDGDYAGLVVHAASRVESAAAGGQILLTESTLSAVEPWPDGVDVIDLGLHRLKDLPVEMRLFQVVADGLERNFPPVRGVAELRNNVPNPVSTFIGRRESLAQLSRSLDADRLVSLVGPGGTGKTRLAIQSAGERLHRHPGGVWFVELATTAGAPTATSAIAEAIGIQEERGRPLLDTVSDSLRSEDALLVLDNCEHILDAVAPIVEHLLRACARLRVLTTTREPLEIEGERLFPVSPLSLQGDVGEVSEAVLLLTDRVRRVRPAFELEGEEAEAAAAIAARLDGLPLALELAASSAMTLSLADIAGQLDRRFELLTRGSRTALDRQKTLWGAIDWSYDLLSDDERALFARLAAFPGEFDHETVSGVCAQEGTGATALLDGLVRKSLVAPTPAGRFRLLESIRAYARERLEASGEAAAIAERHARWFAEIVLDPSHPPGPTGEGGVLSIDVVYDDLAGGLHWAADHDGPLALDLLRPLQSYWATRGRWTEGRTRTAHVLRATEMLATRPRVDALIHDAELALMLGDAIGYRSRIEEAIALAGEIGGDGLRQLLLANLGAIAAREGDLGAAEELYVRARAVAESAGERDTTILDAHLAEIARRRGDVDAAWERASGALQMARDAGESDLVLRLVNLLGDVAHQRGEHDAARDLYGEALDLARAAEDRGQVAYLLYCLARLALDAEEVREAASFLRDALELGRDLDSRDDLVESLEATARLALARNDGVAGARLVGAVDTAREAIGFPRPPADEPTHEALVARLRHALGDHGFATAHSAGCEVGLDAAVSEALAFLEDS